MGDTALIALFTWATTVYQLPTGLISSICYVESNHRSHAMNYSDGPADSIGVCQIQLNTAKMFGFSGTAKELLKPRTNIMYASEYLRWQLIRYDHDVYKAIAAYNSGTYLENPQLKRAKNRGYVSKVLKAWSEGR